MPGITDRPLPPVAVPPAPGAAAALPGGPSRPGSEGLDEAIQETIERSPKSDKESWKRLYADFPRGRDRTYMEKAQWAARAYKREDLAEHQRNWLRGQWTNYAFAHHYRAVEVTIHHLDEQNRPVALRRVDGFDDDGVASIKSVQFAGVQPETWKGYINEVRRKYQPGRWDVVIAPTKGTKEMVARGELDEDDLGAPLRGDMYLDVPSQREPIPQEAFDYAESKGVIIRIREPHPDAGDLDD